MGEKGKLYVVSVNFDKEKHKDLIKQIKQLADEQERSVSSLFIMILKEYLDKNSRGDA